MSSLDPIPDDHRPLKLANLLFLTLCSAPDQSHLLTAPKLQRLTYYFWGLREFYTRPIDFHGEQWPELLHLDLLLYHELRVNFHGRFMLCKLTLRYPAGVASICYQMALHPGLFPVLQELYLMSPPEWDILCIMLEKRLVARTKGVKGLTRLYVGYVAPDIRHLIQTILNGQISERGSNYELSFLRISESLCDNTM
ncbi:hypothetical protein PIIN_04118 [Serendipita indica DSM 11827]|uniref:Uncharacterized protein n=1 Tax=Serendipita indica (strain DSM 11827) TaxID=1109443 RepID=G4TFS8_SERID|nr:hypothetical protein PIIN_04118 [Serendipita indica DSM 11827]